MGNRNKDRKEKTFQESFVKEMEKYRWEAPDFLDGNKHKVTVDDLIEHWRKELNRINADQLEGVPLTDNEFRQVMEKVNKISNSYYKSNNFSNKSTYISNYCRWLGSSCNNCGYLLNCNVMYLYFWHIFF